jgi:hypothetical protein
MNIGDRVKICEALGLDANKVMRLVLILTPDSANLEVTLKVSDEAPGVFSEVIKKYKLTERDGGL